MGTILIVDDEKSIRHSLAACLIGDGHEVHTSGDVASALSFVGEHTVDVIISDVVMPRESGIDLLEQVGERDPLIKVIMITGDPNVNTASASVRGGAFDYLSKPVTRALISRVTRDACTLIGVEREKQRLEVENQSYRDRLEAQVTERTTELQKQEQETALRTAYLESLFEHSPEAIVLASPDGIIQQVNHEFERMFGFSKAKAVGNFVDDLIVPEHLRNEGTGMTTVAAQGELGSMETRRMRKDGAFIDVSILSSPIEVDGCMVAVYAIYRDISARKQAEKAVKASEEEYRSIFDTAAALIASINHEGTIIDCNKRTYEILGYRKDEVMGESMVKFIHPDYLEKAQQSLNEILIKGRSFNKEYKMVRKDGAIIDVSINSSGLKEENGSYVRAICIIEDVTERKQTEQALRESEEQFRRLFENSNDAIFIHTLDGAILDVNARACEMLGFREEELIKMKVRNLHPETKMESAIRGINATREQGHAVFESQFQCADGSLIHVEISSRIIDPDQGVVQGIVRDISGRKRAEAQLWEEQVKRKNVIVNTTHLLHTPLTIVKGNLELALLGRKELTTEKIEKLVGKLKEMDRLISGSLYQNIETMTVETSDGYTPAVHERSYRSDGKDDARTETVAARANAISLRKRLRRI